MIWRWLRRFIAVTPVLTNIIKWFCIALRASHSLAIPCNIVFLATPSHEWNGIPLAYEFQMERSQLAEALAVAEAAVMEFVGVSIALRLHQHCIALQCIALALHKFK